MTPFTTHDNVTIDRPGVEVWLAGVQDKPTKYTTLDLPGYTVAWFCRGKNQETFVGLCYRGHVFAHRENAVAYRRELLLKRRAEIDAELKDLDDQAGSS